MKITEFLLAYLAKQYGTPETELAAQLFKKAEDGTLTDELNDSALTDFLEKDKERVSVLKVDKTQIFNDAYAKAKAEEAAKAEKAVAKAFNITPAEGQKLDEIIEAAKAATATPAKAQPMTDDIVKTHPVYLRLEQDKTEAVKTVEAEYKTKIQEMETGLKRKETLNAVTGKVKEHFLALKPVLPSDAAKANTLTSDFLSQFERYDYEPHNGDYIVMQNGKRLEDAHGHPITASRLAEEQAKARFDFHVQDPKGSAGNAGTTGGSRVAVPKNRDEFNAAVLAAKTAEERLALATAYTAATGEQI